MEVSGQLYAPAALSAGKEHLVSLDGRLGGPNSCYGQGGIKEKNPSIASAGN